ncbi:MAG: HAMP domain-containing histidine kinase [Gammaproteobacteria bacterium]|nr:HAMP domain-containing histidine kinase [Gammaproteobacteria bacterium]
MITSSRIKQLQFDLIFSSSPYSILAAVLAALTQFFLLKVSVDSPVLDIWIVGSLSIYLVGYLLLRIFAKRKERSRADYYTARQFLLVMVIMMGLSWGSAGLFLIPLVDIQAQLVILILTIAVVTETASTLSYKYKMAISFIVIVTAPMMVGIYIAGGLATAKPLLASFLVSFYMMFLIKYVMDTCRNVERMLTREVQSVNRERELRVKSEQANQVSRAKSEFLANMSHEMRTPMHAILGFSDLGANKSASISREKLQGYFFRINESGERLLNLLNALIDLSNLEAGRIHFQISKNDMRSTIDSVIAQMRPVLDERSIKVDIISRVDVTIAHYDNEKLMQVIKNLVDNAIKISPEGSVVSVVIEAASLPPVISAAEQKHRLALSVSVVDQGTGIAENELVSIFDKLAQSSKMAARTGEAGLGLSICKEIIQHHNGIIEAHNNDATGATFTFTIPLEDKHDTISDTQILD